MTNISIVPNKAEEAKNSRVFKLRLSNNRKSLVMSLKNGKTYLFTPTQEDIKAYYIASATKYCPDYNEALEYDMPNVEDIAFTERWNLSQYFKSEWQAINLIQPTLVQRAQKQVRRATKTKYNCLMIDKAYYEDKKSYLLIGGINGVNESIKGTTLKECVAKMIDKINNDKVKALCNK